MLTLMSLIFFVVGYLIAFATLNVNAPIYPLGFGAVSVAFYVILHVIAIRLKRLSAQIEDYREMKFEKKKEKAMAELKAEAEEV